MPALSFYRQARADGGVRTGINVEGDLLLESFEPGGSEPDPALLWYVEIRCNGTALPTDREAVRQWFREQESSLKRALLALAEKLEVGSDETWPYQYAVPDGPTGTTVKIVCSAVRGLELGTLASVLRDIAKSWDHLLKQLGPSEVLA